MRLLGVGIAAAAPVAAGLAQISEFSFLLVNLAIGLNLLHAEARDLALLHARGAQPV